MYSDTRYHIIGQWEKFKRAVKGATDAATVAAAFPFTEFFSNAPQPLFAGADVAVDVEVARGCMRFVVPTPYPLLYRRLSYMYFTVPSRACYIVVV